jgi:hypothetical protein
MIPSGSLEAMIKELEAQLSLLDQKIAVTGTGLKQSSLKRIRFHLQGAMDSIFDAIHANQYYINKESGND